MTRHQSPRRGDGWQVEADQERRAREPDVAHPDPSAPRRKEKTKPLLLTLPLL